MKVFILRILVVVTLFFLSIPFSGAQSWKQKRFETVLGFGPSQFFADIGGFSRGKNAGGLRDMSIPQSRFDLNLDFKYRISQRFNARISLTYGFLHASDERGSNAERGYEASVSIFEPALIAEYYFIMNKDENHFMLSRDENGKKTFGRFLQYLDFYAFTGVGGLSYNVAGNDKLVSTGMDPKGFTAIIPVGAGTTFLFSKDFNFGIEIGGRYSFSDSLDGYSSTYSSSNDMYGFLNFTITYKLNTGSNGLPTFR